MERELRTLTIDFGVSAETMPEDFLEKVRRWAKLYQTRDRSEMKRVLEIRSKEFQEVQRQVADANLPSELAFLTLVESHFQARIISPSGSAGLWQFTSDTAKRCGLQVDADVDERLDPRKSTRAACLYLHRLRQHLQPHGSLLLALVAYNMGPGRLKQRMNRIEDPAQRHDFWHLYRVRVFPALTRNHLARLMAAILIGRHPQHFGFKSTPIKELEVDAGLCHPPPIND